MRISKATLSCLYFILFVIAIVIASGCSLTHIETTEIVTPSSTMAYINPTDITETLVTLKQTPMPLPTLSPTEAVELVRELFITNGNCELPCFWGIVPGQATWDQTRTFFETFATAILSFPLEEGEKIYHQTGVKYSAIFHNPKDRSARDIEVLIFVNNDGIVTILGVPLINNSIHDILEEYGIPSEIWLKFTGEWPGDYKDYSIALYYPEKGMMYAFWGKGSTVFHNGEKYLKMCSDDPGNRAGPWLWSPHIPIPFEDIALLRLAPLYDARYGRISEVTNMDEKTFYESFIAGPTCFETPYSVWPINPPTLTP